EHLPFKERVLGSSPSQITFLYFIFLGEKPVLSKSLKNFVSKGLSRDRFQGNEMTVEILYGKPQPNHFFILYFFGREACPVIDFKGMK
ncbi:MAG: hypothetical protein LAT51_13180, partial [Flavobacteriaceae bacterium]|nr:hypothetical protein [Flavobacteriaceae bacterium]